MNTTQKGNITELKVALILLEKGFTVLRPMGEGCRYDLLLDEGGTFKRIQCKSGWLRNGVILFNACSNYCWKKGSPKYHGSADLFGVACEGNCYLVPVEVIKSNRGYLRLSATLNRQSKGILMAEQFKI